MDERAAETRSGTDRIVGGLVVVLVVFAAVLRFYDLGGHSIWLDESSSIKYSRTLELAFGRVFHPPGYYFVLHVWSRVFGDSAAALRAVSAISGTITVYAVYRVGVLLFRHWGPALVAAGLFAVLPEALWFSRELRMYAPWTMFLVLALWALVSIHEHGLSKGRVAAYWGAIFGAALMHHYTVFYAGVLAGCAFLLMGAHPVKKTKTDVRDWLILHGPFALGAVVILVRVADFAGDRGLVGYILKKAGGEEPQPIGASLAHLFFFRNWAYRVGGVWADLFGGVLFWVLVVASGIFGLDSKISPARRATLLLLAWVPFITIVVSPIRNYARVVTPSAAMLTLLLGYGFAWPAVRYGRKLAVVSVILVSGMLFMLSPRIYDVYTLEVESWNAVCDKIEAEQGPNEAILISASFMKKTFAICYDGPSEVTGFPKWEADITTESAVESVMSKPGVWVIYSHAGVKVSPKRKRVADMHKEAVRRLSGRFRLTDRWRAGSKIEVFHFER